MSDPQRSLRDAEPPLSGDRGRRQRRFTTVEMQRLHLKCKLCRPAIGVAGSAQSRQLLKPGGLSVGSIKIQTVPMVVRASNGIWTPVGLW